MSGSTEGRSTGGSRERAATVRERARSLAERAAAAVPESRTRPVRVAATLAALGGLGALTATRIALNAPVALPSAASGAWFDAATAAAVVGPAAAALLLGVTADEPWTRIGLVLVGVFGLLSTASPAAAVSAVGGVVVGGWLTLVGAVATDRAAGRRARGEAAAVAETVAISGVVAAALLAGLTLSLFGAVGVRPGVVRPAGTTLALAGMAATPLAFRAGGGAYAVGGLAAGATYYLTGAAPFLSGAVVLVAGSVVGASAVSLAAAVGGLIATIATGATKRRVEPAAAGLLLLAAGVPSSIPRALGAALAAALVAETLFDRTGGHT
jgi:hypothetical protein